MKNIFFNIWKYGWHSIDQVVQMCSDPVKVQTNQIQWHMCIQSGCNQSGQYLISDFVIRDNGVHISSSFCVKYTSGVNATETSYFMLLCFTYMQNTKSLWQLAHLYRYSALYHLWAEAIALSFPSVLLAPVLGKSWVATADHQMGTHPF